MKKIILASIIAVVCGALFITCIKKIGRERVLSLAVKVFSPACIILFYLSGVSVIVPILKCFKVTDNIVLSSDSIRVAVDSAIVTLLVNTLLSFLSSPIKVEIEAKSRQDLEQVLVYCNRNSKIDYMVKVSSEHRWMLEWYKKYKEPVLRINNTINTSMALDREEEYENVIDCSNASKYIDVHIKYFPESGKIYFTLFLQSDKTIKWDDVIKTDFYIGTSNKLEIHALFWQIKKSMVRIAHREERYD